MRSAAYSLGIDIGGTFTDLVLTGPGGAFHTHKLLSTPDDYGRAISDGVASLIREHGVDAADIGRVVHGTTVATNTILESKGARTALITTKGFRDVLEMRRLRIPAMYTLNYQRPDPLVPRRLRLEVGERMGPSGDMWRPLDEASVDAAIEKLQAAKVEAVAICFLHAYANADHEQRVGERVRSALGDDAFVTCSSDLLPVIREYERTSTTVINAYLGPVVRRYLNALGGRLRELGITAPVLVMKSDGGVMSARTAAERPAYIVESGPAAGVIGAAHVNASAAGNNCITLDMGGTTAKAAIVEGGRVAKTSDFEVGAGINLSSKLVMGGGYALKLPVVEISEIGAGGGSLVRVDGNGRIEVGPDSAGADPGPVAYARGGKVATFTDAAIALGYLNQEYLVGGAVAIDAEKATDALTEQVAAPLGKDLLDAVRGVLDVACGTMVRAVKAVSTYSGRDPRDFTLFAFGGNGPVVGAAIAEMLDMRRVVVPPNPGVFSAYGLLTSDIEQEAVHAYIAPLTGSNPSAFGGAFERLDAELSQLMSEEGFADGDYTVERLADLRYAGQAHELPVSVTLNGTGVPDLQILAQAFGDEHARTYGHKAEDEGVECVTLRAIARVAVDKPAPAAAPARAGSLRERLVFFGPRHGRLATPVVTRDEINAEPRPGPLIVEEYDASVVVPPGWMIQRDASHNLILERTAAQ